MDAQEEALAAWEQRLRVAEHDLQQREQQALAHDPTQSELLAFATEHDKLALDRDSIATAYDDRATARDQTGLGRDVAGSGRDRRARGVSKDRDPAFGDRSFAGQDRDYAAGERSDSHVDRSRGRQARQHAAAARVTGAVDRDRAAEQAEALDHELAGLRTALESRVIIGQAQGLLMARHNVAAEAAFAVLVRLSQHGNVKLREVAAQVVKDFEATQEQRPTPPAPEQAAGALPAGKAPAGFVESR